MSNDRVCIRGTSAGLVITLGAGDLRSLLRELDERLSSTASFFRGGRVALHVGPRVLHTEDLEALGRTLSHNGISLWAVIGDNAATQATAEAMGLETTLFHREPHSEWDERRLETGVEGAGFILPRGPMSDHPLVRDFIRFVLDSYPQTPWPALYDCMVNAAVMRRFRGLGLSELRAAGVPLSLSAMDELEILIEEARRLPPHSAGQAYPEQSRGVDNLSPGFNPPANC